MRTTERTATKKPHYRQDIMNSCVRIEYIYSKAMGISCPSFLPKIQCQL